MFLFMGNPCGYGRCMQDTCSGCPAYKPTMFGYRVPKWLGDLGFEIQSILIYVAYNLRNKFNLK